MAAVLVSNIPEILEPGSPILGRELRVLVQLQEANDGRGGLARVPCTSPLRRDSTLSGPQSIGQKLTGAQLLPAGQQDGNGVPSRPLIRLNHDGAASRSHGRAEQPSPPTSQY
jgi:hypothetical protein